MCQLSYLFDILVGFKLIVRVAILKIKMHCGFVLTLPFYKSWVCHQAGNNEIQFKCNLPILVFIFLVHGCSYILHILFSGSVVELIRISTKQIVHLIISRICIACYSKFCRSVTCLIAMGDKTLGKTEVNSTEKVSVMQLYPHQMLSAHCSSYV